MGRKSQQYQTMLRAGFPRAASLFFMIGWANQGAKRRSDSLQGKSLLLLWLFGAIFVSSTLIPSAQCREKQGAPATDPPLVSPSAAATPLTANAVTSGRQALMLRRLWGIEDVHVRYTASGSMVRFSYRIVDADKARVLNDKSTDPYMIVNKTGARLEVPTTEKVGKLRQTAIPENGREYWMVFTNAGRVLKPGDHVDIVIGTFRAKELIVESPRLTPRVQKP
jgi:hypothetical protein